MGLLLVCEKRQWENYKENVSDGNLDGKIRGKLFCKVRKQQFNPRLRASKKKNSCKLPFGSLTSQRKWRKNNKKKYSEENLRKYFPFFFSAKAKGKTQFSRVFFCFVSCNFCLSKFSNWIQCFSNGFKKKRGKIDRNKWKFVPISFLQQENSKGKSRWFLGFCYWFFVLLDFIFLTFDEF